MGGYSFKESLFLGGALVAIFLILVTLVVIGGGLRKSDALGRQSLLAQRVVFSVVQDRRVKAVGDLTLLPDAFKGSASGRWDSLATLHLLDQGGSIADEYIPRIDSSEISRLLKSSIALLQAQANSQPQTSSYDSLTTLIREKVQALSEALAFRAIALKNRVSVAFWFLLLWFSVLLLCGFFGARIFCLREKRLKLENQFLGLGKELLQSLPEAFILLDKTLTMRFVNRLAESYVGPLQGFRKERYFGAFCQDKMFLEHLQNALQEIYQGSPKKVFSESQEVLLKLSGGRQKLVRMQFYKITLIGQSYLLGALSDPEETRRENLNFVVSQERLKDLSNNLFKAQDEERRHLADELHDGLCQSLAALKMQVFSVERHIEKVELQEECRRARQFIAQIIEDVRRLSHDLSPVILDDLGLSEALVHLVNNFTALNNLKASISVPDLDDIFTGDAARNIYRIAQEAINNIGKHAKASLVLLEAEIKGDEVRFSIKDDGVGFEIEGVQKGSPGAGLGLASMAQRIHLMDGKLSLVSHPGDGCQVIFTLPKK